MGQPSLYAGTPAGRLLWRGGGSSMEHGAASLVSFAALGDHVLMSTAPRARLRADPGVGELWTQSSDPPRTT